MKLATKRVMGLAAALLLGASTSAARDLIVDNDWSSDTFMPLLVALADNSSSLIGIVSFGKVASFSWRQQLILFLLADFRVWKQLGWAVRSLVTEVPAVRLANLRFLLKQLK